MQKKMKRKTSIAILTMVILMVFASMIAVMPIQPVQAASTQPYSGPLKAGDTVDFQVSTTAYLNVRPSLVGVGQTILVNIWVLPAPHTQRKFLDLKVTITKPDETQDVLTMDSYPADGTSWFEYIVDQTGTWKFKYDFPGMYFPAGRYIDGYLSTAATGGAVYGSVYYKPSSTKETLITVQEEIEYSFPDLGLPTDYWTRPIAYEHREWWTIAGNNPWHGPGGGAKWDELYPDTSIYWNDRYRFTPWVQGPNTAHIVWKRLENLGGLIQFGEYTGPFTLTVSVGTPSIIYSGRCYQSLTKTMPDGTATNVWQCYDLRTGEIYWERTGVSAPTVIEYDRGTPETAGGEARQMGNTGNVHLVYIGGGSLIKYSPATGAVTGNYSIAPLTTGTYYMNQYALSVQNIGTTASPNYRLINWTIRGTSNTLSARIVSNTTYARSSLPTIIDWGIGAGATASKQMVSGAPANTTITGFNLQTGAQLWTTTVDEWTYSGSCAVADHGKVAVLMEQGYWMAWDLLTGKLAWKSERMDYPWGEPGYGAYSVQSAYGMLFRQSYDGIYAVDWDTGKIVWKYSAPSVSSFETPYTDSSGGQGVYSFDSHANIVDGKMYTLNNEHTPTSPITRGWGVHCINITTGELIWKMAGPWTWGAPGLIADGYLTCPSAKGEMYVFGKGQSATTITAPDVIVPLGTSVLLKGTILDQSPAQAGTPCVSKESMALQMEYLHTQMPIDGIWHNETITGVSVSLDTLDPNGNYVHIGDVTSDGYSGTFGFTWEPEVPGQYTVTATFMGDDSYGSSFATTSVSVGEAAAATATPEPTQPAPDNTILLYGILIVAIAALVVGLLALLRKR